MTYCVRGGGQSLNLTALNVNPAQGNMEGHEVRFGQALTALFIAGTSGDLDGRRQRR